jgi:Lipase (class 3)
MSSAEVPLVSSPLALPEAGDETSPSIFTGTTSTPPVTPRRGHHSFSMTAHLPSFKMSNSPAKKSPGSEKSPANNNRRASTPSEANPVWSTLMDSSAHSNNSPLPPDSFTQPADATPFRSTMMESSANSNDSPLPPTSRPQSSTATAPVVGAHKKNISLLGFDPLMNSELLESQSIGSKKPTTSLSDKDHQFLQVPSTPKAPKATATAASVPAAMSDLSLSPLSPQKNGAEVAMELRKIAKDLATASPQNPSSANNLKVSKPKFGQKASSTPKFTLTPPFRSSFTPSTATPTKEPTSAPHRKLPWQRHRRSMSLETPGAALPHTTSLENDATKANTGATIIMSLESPMMQDLFEVVKLQESTVNSLALPSLAKPAPTSFLTGTEVVRSSEHDPSPFQMEIPSLDQTLVAARLVQFVEHYRKEDMNMDLSMSLVGLSRREMASFVEDTDSSQAPPNLTQVHKPVVESLLEAAEDATVAGFVATQNAGSADARREAVILERQMQFIIVFRGTTQEQAGKTGFFKKNHAKPKHQVALEPFENDGTDAKVFAPIKEAYIELEHRVFDCLDRLMDANPFCDVVFTGSSWGACMATLAAYRYASNRPMARVSCQTFGAPKVGNKVFRQQVNSLPNLKVIRIEHASDVKCLAPPQDNGNGAPAGHSIVLSKNSENYNELSAVACKFDSGKHHSTKPAAALFNAWKKERDISTYVSHLEQLQQSKGYKWVKDFAGEDGSGVRGKDNEQRQMV